MILPVIEDSYRRKTPLFEKGKYLKEEPGGNRSCSGE
jgi:hypothetical protein